MGHKYTRAGLVDIATVLRAVANTKVSSIVVHGQKVKTTGLRLRTFAEHGIVCSSCGIKATHFAVEQSPNASNYHLNLWGFNARGQEELFTCDHTLARCLGGKNHLSNTTTMCSRCNHKKGNEEGREFQRRQGIHVHQSSNERRRAQSFKRAEAYELYQRMAVEPMLHAVSLFRKREAKLIKADIV